MEGPLSRIPGCKRHTITDIVSSASYRAYGRLDANPAPALNNYSTVQYKQTDRQTVQYSTVPPPLIISPRRRGLTASLIG